MSDNGGERTDVVTPPHFLWWFYFALLLIMFASGLVTFAAEGLFSTLRATLLSAALLIHDALCIAGLYAYIRALPLFFPAFWRIMLTLLVARLFVSASFLVPNLIAQDAGRERLVALTGLALMALWAPLLVALWRYAFKSPQVWNGAKAA